MAVLQLRAEFLEADHKAFCRLRHIEDRVDASSNTRSYHRNGSCVPVL